MKIINHIAKVDNEQEFYEALSKTTFPRWYYTEEELKRLPEDKIIGVDFDIFDIKDFDDFKHFNENAFSEAKKLYHKNCKATNIIGKLLGIQITEEDLYWILETEDGKITYDTCVDEIREI